jgi:hypothetical protein
VVKSLPYGVSKKAGGDSADNDAKMERCVADVMAKGHDKVSAIKICKSRLFNPVHRNAIKKA